MAGLLLFGWRNQVFFTYLSEQIVAFEVYELQNGILSA